MSIGTTGIDMFQAIAPNAFYVFAGPSPPTTRSPTCCSARRWSSTRASATSPATSRLAGAASSRRTSGASADTFTLNYGLRYERINPFSEAERSPERVHPRHAVARCGPMRRRGLLFPGDPGVGDGIAQSYNAWMPRVGSCGTRPAGASGRCARATGSSTTSSRTDRARPRQVAISSAAVGAVQPVQRRRA